MWLTSSSIGRKFIMALTGACLVLFVTFHVLMNSVALLWPAAYNSICGFLGANWYALIASAGLAALFIIHIIYAVWLTVQNRRARGTSRYAVNSRPPQVEWSSKNMLVLGIVILAFLVVHMTQFWAKMQLQELISHEMTAFPVIAGAYAAPEFGTLFLQAAFELWWTPVVYIIGFVALWFHMNHGFWSMFHTIGWDNNVWIERLKKIGCWWTSIVILLFVAQAILFTVQAKEKFFLTDPALVAQYEEYLVEKAEPQIEDIRIKDDALRSQAYKMAPADAQKLFEDFILNEGPKYLETLAPVATTAKVLVPNTESPVLKSVPAYVENITLSIEQIKQRRAADAAAAAAENQTTDNN